MWHDPHLTTAGRRKEAARGSAAGSVASDEDDPAKRKRRNRKRAADAKRAGARIVARSEGTTDPREAEQERLLYRLLNVEGRPAISSAAHAYLEAGFEFPRNQFVWLQLLEHRNEQTVSEAITQLGEILLDEVPARRAVLDSRLRRIEEFADDSTLREAAGDLRRLLSGRGSAPSSSED